MGKNKFSILVNTCDKFDDCWNPFFKLFSTFWKSYKGKIYLNTEYKNYSYKNLNIISVKGCEEKQDANLITWSECLKRALESMEEDVVLYLQEDYFFKDNVENDIVEQYVDLMDNNENIHCIHLTDQAVKGSKESKEYEGLNIVDLKQRYRISCQAALWRKDVLLGYIRTYESAWEFEEFGSQRAERLQHKFYVVKAVNNRNLELNEFEIIPYIFTGIVQGRWFEEVVPHFRKHNINIDYSIRGFVKEAPRRSLKTKLYSKWKRLPALIKNFLDLRNL